MGRRAPGIGPRCAALYARHGREVLAQPGQLAWPIFDAGVGHRLRDEYRIRQVTKVTADRLEALVERMGVDAAAALATIQACNAACPTDVAFDPTVEDGRCTAGLEVPKSNWANSIDQPPFEAHPITCGITFTFGGLRITTEGRVLDEDLVPITGLYAAGELVGGLFYGNHPGGTGLTSGAVLGRLAGAAAARVARPAGGG